MGVNTLQDNNEQTKKQGQDNISFDERKYNSQLSEIKKEKEKQLVKQGKERKNKMQELNLPSGVINFNNLVQDLLTNEGFSDDIINNLENSKDLLNGYSVEDIYEDFASMSGRATLLNELYKIDDINERKEKLENALKKQHDLVEKYYNELELSKLSDEISKPILRHFDDLQNWSSLSQQEKLCLCTDIIKDMSDEFKIKCPDIVGIKILGIAGLGSKEIIKLDITGDDPGEIVNLMAHEFTHCLQDYRKTPSGTATKESNENYAMPMNDGLDELAFSVYNQSLMEKEAVFVGEKVKTKFLNYK